MTFEKIGLNTEGGEKSNETEKETSDVEVFDAPRQQEQIESPESMELLIDTEKDMLEGLLQERIIAAVEQESEKYEEKHKIEEPTEDENIESKEQQQENIESAGISSIIDKMPKKAKRFINAMTMASIIIGGIGVSMMPSTAEAAGNTYGLKEQVDDYRAAYKKEKQRIHKMDTARHKAKQATAKARTKTKLKKISG